MIHETIDGETIIIDLVSGSYYSLQGSGPEIWNHIGAGASESTIVARFAAGHEGDPAEVAQSVTDFLSQLEGEQLIAEAERPSDVTATLAEPAPDATFVTPKLEKYTDMQDIILLDPVHQVDNRGWPHADQTS